MTYVFSLRRQRASRIMSSQVTKVVAVVPAASFYTVREKRHCERLLASQINRYVSDTLCL